MFRECLDRIRVSEDGYFGKTLQLFPTAEERWGWDHLDEELKNDLIGCGEKYLNCDWPALTASMYRAFVENGDRNIYERPHFLRRNMLGRLTIAECAEGKGRFIDDIINGIWCICEESTWMLSAHNHMSGSVALPDITKPCIDLMASETGAMLSWVYYLLQARLDQVSPSIGRQIRWKVKERILDPYLERDDFWWMGFVKNQNHNNINNWYTWCNSNCLNAFLLQEEDKERRRQAVVKCMKSLDQFIGGYPADGGCNEGFTYWGMAGGALFDCLELLYRISDGKIEVYDQPLIREIGRYVYRVHISGDYFINFADGDAKVNLVDYEDGVPSAFMPAELVYRYGCRIGDELLMRQGLGSFKISGESILKAIWFPMYRVLSSIFNYGEMKKTDTRPPYIRDAWLKDIQVMAAREKEGSDRGLYLAAKGGHNQESHNHNDVGQFIVYYDGYPVIVDAGVESYTGKTFGKDRYKIWTMQSSFHNLPQINGEQQKAGREFCAREIFYRADDCEVKFSMDISAAYPPEADIERWKRTFRFNRNGNVFVEILDDFRLQHASCDIQWNLLTPCECMSGEAGTCILQVQGGQKVVLAYNEKELDLSTERVSTDDIRMGRVWGDHLFRIVLRLKEPKSDGINKLRFSAL